MDAAPANLSTPPAPVRVAVRDLLTSHPEFGRLDPATRSAIARGSSMYLGERRRWSLGVGEAACWLAEDLVARERRGLGLAERVAATAS